MKRIKLILYVISVSIFSFENAYAYERSELVLPRLQIMPGMNLEQVAYPIIYNKKLMSISNFTTKKSIKDVMSYYSSLFKLKGHGDIAASTMGSKQVIGYEKNGYLYSLEVDRAGSGSSGSIVISRLKNIKNVIHVFPMRINDKLLTHIISFDAGIEAETLILTSQNSMSANRNWYRDRLMKLGWVRYIHHANKNTHEEQYQRGSQSCQVIYSSSGLLNDSNSLIQIHWIKG